MVDLGKTVAFGRNSTFISIFPWLSTMEVEASSISPDLLHFTLSD